SRTERASVSRGTRTCTSSSSSSSAAAGGRPNTAAAGEATAPADDADPTAGAERAHVGPGRRALEADDTEIRGPVRPQFSQVTSSPAPETPVRNRAKAGPCQ